MKVYGVTGGVGMGKSTSYQLLSGRGEMVIDTDLIARELVEPGQLALSEITTAFGPYLLDDTGCLRRDELARIVFKDPSKRLKLESILHPRIQARWQTQVSLWKGQGAERCFVVIPLLFENQLAPHFDVIVCVACSSATQQHRLLARGWDALQIQQRIAAQLAVEKKLALAHRVIWTEGNVLTHWQQWSKFL